MLELQKYAYIELDKSEDLSMYNTREQLDDLVIAEVDKIANRKRVEKAEVK